MEAIVLLNGVKFLIDFFEGNWTSIAIGILLPPVVNDLYTLGDSVFYLFDIDGNMIGTKDISSLKEFKEGQINILNKNQALIGFEKAKKQLSFSKGNSSIGFTK